MADLKAVCAAVDEQAALAALDIFVERWNKKYPKISQSWRENWPNLSTYFKYPQKLRRLIYTTNAIEGFNRQLRKVTKSKAVFPTDENLFKMLYLFNEPMVDLLVFLGQAHQAEAQLWHFVHFDHLSFLLFVVKQDKPFPRFCLKNEWKGPYSYWRTRLFPLKKSLLCKQHFRGAQ